MADEAKATVEIVESPAIVEDQPVTVDEATEAGLSKEEIDMGKEQGDIVDKKPVEKKEDEGDDEDKKDGDADKKDDNPENKDDKDVKDEIEDDPEKEADKVKDYTPNEKAQYFQRKKERTKRQKAERKSELLEIKLKAEKEKNELLKSGKKYDDMDDLDADLDADLNGDKDNDDDIVTKGDLRKSEEKMEAKRIAEWKQAKAVAVAESLEERYTEAREENANFDAYCDLASEVMDEDEKEGGTYALKVVQLAHNPEGKIADYIMKLAKLHDGYNEVGKGKSSKSDKKEGKDGADKIINNASKRTSSASVGGGNGRRIVSEDDLTVQDAAKLSDAAWDKLKPETRERLLRS